MSSKIVYNVIIQKKHFGKDKFVYNNKINEAYKCMKTVLSIFQKTCYANVLHVMCFYHLKKGLSALL